MGLARSLYGASESHGKSGRLSIVGCRAVLSALLLVLLRRQRHDQGVVLRDLAELGGATGASEVVEELDVGLVEVLPLFGCVVLVEDGLDRADRLTGATVDALVRVDVERALTLIDAVDGTFLDAGLVLDVDTRLGDDVGHGGRSSWARHGVQRLLCRIHGRRLHPGPSKTRRMPTKEVKAPR